MIEEVGEEHIYEIPKKHRNDQNEIVTLLVPPLIQRRKKTLNLNISICKRCKNKMLIETKSELAIRVLLTNSQKKETVHS